MEDLNTLFLENSQFRSVVFHEFILMIELDLEGVETVE